MSQPLRVLLVEDSEDDARLLLRELQRGGYDLTVERVDTLAAMQAALDRQAWDIVISDYSLPQFSAPAALEVLKATGLDLPFIIASGTIGEEAAVASLKAGAHDFFSKGQLARLNSAVERELHEAEVRRARRLAEEQLRQAEARYRTLVEHIPAITYVAPVADPSSVLYFSPQLEATLGFSDAEWKADPKLWLNQLHPDDRPRVLEMLNQSIANGESFRCEYRMLARDGRVVWILDQSGLIWDESGQPRLLQGVLLDITERKRAEEQIRQQLERLATLRAIDMTIVASTDLRLTLRTLLEGITTQLEVDAAAVLLLNPNAQTLEYAAGRGFQTNTIESSRPRLGEGYPGRAALERRIIRAPDLSKATGDLTRVLLLKVEAFRAYYGVPLLARGQIMGVLEIFHRTPLNPDQAWLDFLEALAGQAAIAVENARLFDGLQRSNLDLTLAYETTLEGWSRALDLRDKETEGHTLRVTEMTLRLARAIGMREADLVHVRRGALLHDIGKMGIPDNILLKPGPLSEEEWDIMRKHPAYAYELLSPISFLRPALDIPYYHHEKWDGTGYPRGLKDEQIPLAARIFAVADVWDALRSDRPYRAGWPEAKVREHVRTQSGRHFDPNMVEALLNLLGAPNAESA